MSENDYQQQDEYRRWLADEEAQREYQEYLDLCEQIEKAFEQVFGEDHG